MSELALKLIRENIEKHERGEDATFLDLGNCGMTEVPEEIGECVWLEELVFSSKVGDWESENSGDSNKIAVLPVSFSRLKKLKKLWLPRSSFNLNFKGTDLSTLESCVDLELLDCSNSNVSDLSPLSNLIKLQIINCYSTKILDLSPLKHLNNLKDLNISYCRGLSSLAPLIGLNNLQEVDFSVTQVSDLSPLQHLKNLQGLKFSACTQISDLSPLKELKELRRLDFSATKVSDLAPLKDLENLESINCSYTSVSDFSQMLHLIRLKTLWCSELQISDWSLISNFRQLQHFGCGSSNLSDLKPLSDLNQLWEVNCVDTDVSDLSPLSNLPNLETIRFSNTKVADLLPISNLILAGCEILYDECPLIIPPLEVAQESPQAVRDYFEELGDDGQKLNEVKVIFLGEASAGKTSLVKRLMGENFDSKESQTHGIRIRKMPFAMEDGDTVTAHLWDFGGQEVMHATHQFFLSQRSVYVLLLNSRNDDQAEKWLKHAASFGGRSPVLVVLNKIDENPSFQVDNKRLKEKYPQIREFFRLSAKTDKGLEEFSEALRREIDRADTRRTPFPPHWLAVKEHFSNMQADYIESAEYRKVCAAKGVTRQFSQDVLLKFLHDLGVVINFDKLKNFDTQILNPLWLTNGVYRVINSKIVAEDTGGLLREADFDAVINDPRYNKENTTDRLFEYPKDKLLYIVRVMQEFELCFQLDTRTYVVPQLLPVQEPDFKFEGAILRFVIHFPEFMPDSIFPRLMVKLHTFLAGDTEAVTPSHRLSKNAWRTGMILRKPNIFKALARVRWDKEDQKILVDVCGEDRRRFLSFIRETVKEIVEDFTNLNFSELVPIPESTDTEEYEYLVEAEKAGEKEVFVKSLKKRVSITDLLDGVEESAMRDEVEQLPVKAFVLYADDDLEYLEDLRNGLAVLKRLHNLEIWDKTYIKAGEEWEKVLFQQLEEADIVLCLISSSFIASDFYDKNEFSIALEAHRKGEKTIVPIMLRKTDWKDLPLAEIQGTPGEWITLAKDKDEAWTKVSESLRPALDKAKQRKKVLLEKRKGGFQ
jgi:internalin A